MSGPLSDASPLGRWRAFIHSCIVIGAIVGWRDRGLEGCRRPTQTNGIPRLIEVVLSSSFSTGVNSQRQDPFARAMAWSEPAVVLDRSHCIARQRDLQNRTDHLGSSTSVRGVRGTSRTKLENLRNSVLHRTRPNRFTSPPTFPRQTQTRSQSGHRNGNHLSGGVFQARYPQPPTIRRHIPSRNRPPQRSPFLSHMPSSMMRRLLPVDKHVPRRAR